MQKRTRYPKDFKASKELEWIFVRKQMNSYYLLTTKKGIMKSFDTPYQEWCWQWTHLVISFFTKEGPSWSVTFCLHVMKHMHWWWYTTRYTDIDNKKRSSEQHSQKETRLPKRFIFSKSGQKDGWSVAGQQLFGKLHKEITKPHAEEKMNGSKLQD